MERVQVGEASEKYRQIPGSIPDTELHLYGQNLNTLDKVLFGPSLQWTQCETNYALIYTAYVNYYSLRPKKNVISFSRFECIYILKSVYIHSNLKKEMTSFLGRREYISLFENWKFSFLFQFRSDLTQVTPRWFEFMIGH